MGVRTVYLARAQEAVERADDLMRTIGSDDDSRVDNSVEATAWATLAMAYMALGDYPVMTQQQREQAEREALA